MNIECNIIFSLHSRKKNDISAVADTPIRILATPVQVVTKCNVVAVVKQ